MRGEPAMADSHQRAILGRLKFPAHGGPNIAGPGGDPGGDDEARGSHFQVFAADFEVPAVVAHPDAAPLATGAKIGLKLRATVDALLSPPLRDLRGVDQCLKDALARRGDVDLAEELVRIRCVLRLSHGNPPITVSFAFCCDASTYREPAGTRRTFSGRRDCSPRTRGTDSARNRRPGAARDSVDRSDCAPNDVL